MRKKLLLLILVLLLCDFTRAQTYTLESKWVDCGESVQLLDPYYSDGVSFEWKGSSKDGKANGNGVAIKYYWCPLKLFSHHKN